LLNVARIKQKYKILMRYYLGNRYAFHNSSLFSYIFSLMTAKINF